MSRAVGVEDEGPPSALMCPITACIMMDPVICLGDGHSYERVAIQEWLERSVAEHGHATSPMTNERLETTTLLPNHALRKAVSEWTSNHPSYVVKPPTDAETTELRAQATLRRAQQERQRGAAEPEGDLKDELNRFRLFGDPPSYSIPSSETSASVAAASVAPDWTFDKSTQRSAQKTSARTIVVSASRVSLDRGTGTLTAWETMDNGQDFAMATQTMFAPSKTSYALDPTVSSLVAMSDKTFAAGVRDGSFQTWRLERGAAGLRLERTGGSKPEEAHTDVVTDIAFNATWTSLLGDERLPTTIATSSRDQTVRVWRLDTSGDAGPAAAGGAKAAPAKRASMFGFGTSRAAASSAPAASTPPQATWTTRCVLSGHGSEVFGVATSHDGVVLSCGGNWEVWGWDIGTSTSAPSYRLTSHKKAVRRVAPSPDSALIASGSDDETVMIWDPRASVKTPIATLETGSPVLSLKWSSHHYLVAGGGTSLDSMAGSSQNAGGWIRVWDARRGGEFAVLGDAAKDSTKGLSNLGGADKRRQAHEQCTYALETIVLNGAPCVVSGGDDKKLRLWCSAPRHATLPPFAPAPVLAYTFGGAPGAPLGIDALCVLKA